MKHLLRTSATALALLSGAGFAAAQQTQGNAPSMSPPQSSTSSQPIHMLNPAQRQAIVQGLRGERMQSPAPGEQAQIGSKPPGSVTQRQLPNQVKSDVPETQRLLFVKLPDRILLIDPDQQTVAEIIPTSDTSGQDNQ